MWKSSWVRWGAVLGLALGGFFDGILLHQILQWHHLLSLVEAAGDLRMQILWDGYFHALMYLLAALGLWGLWRSRAQPAAGSGRTLLGALSLGFGFWHLLDALISHWALGIHRIKLDSSNPLAWDLLWLVAFGLIPLAVSWVLLRRPRAGGPGPGAPTLAAVSALVLTAGAWSMAPPPDQDFTTVVFAPGTEPAQAMAAILAADARLVWSGPDMAVVVVEAPGRGWDFYRAGALLVSGSGLPAGCFDWSRA